MRTGKIKEARNFELQAPPDPSCVPSLPAYSTHIFLKHKTIATVFVIENFFLAIALLNKL